MVSFALDPEMERLDELERAGEALKPHDRIRLAHYRRARAEALRSGPQAWRHPERLVWYDPKRAVWHDPEKVAK